MEGPSPVSALIHAATMVTAGVYMVARCGPIFAGSPLALEVVTIVGAAGALFAATMALAQYDMKRILAYSTMSQLAYMFVALGCSAPGSGIFHLYTHAFFKALLFLTAGNVMHAMGNVIDVRQFSGLRRVLPMTYRLMGIGCLALAGFPLLAGFWSKDEIIHAAFYSEMGHHLPWLGWVMVLTSALTAFYTFRMFFLCFHGEQRLPPEAGAHPHDMPPVMMRPLYVLAGGAVIAGFAGVSLTASFTQGFLGFLKPHGGFFHAYLHSSTLVEGAAHPGGMWLMYLSAIVAVAGIGLAYVVYGRAPAADPAQRALGGVWNLWNAKYYVDEFYQAAFVAPLRRLGDFFFSFDRYVIDGLVWFVSAVPRAAAAVLRFMQGGALQGYALSMLIGLAVLVALWRWMDAPPAG
jgi:NADH-quinone oxidoreductase subunit L